MNTDTKVQHGLLCPYCKREIMTSRRRGLKAHFIKEHRAEWEHMTWSTSEGNVRARAERRASRKQTKQ